MQIAAFDNRPKWIPIFEDFEVLVDYPTLDQQHKLDIIQYEEGAASLANTIQSSRYYLKYTIKGWRGLTNLDGEEIQCEIVDNELKNEIWDSFIKLEDLAALTYTKIHERLRWNELDKKKFISSDDSNLKVDSKGKRKNSRSH